MLLGRLFSFLFNFRTKIAVLSLAKFLIIKIVFKLFIKH
jgi:hypothetical protein